MRSPRNRPIFPLFQTPIDLAHDYWQRLLHPGDYVIDATCGNGHDTLFLANLVLKKDTNGQLLAMDTQAEAIQNTQQLLQDNLAKNMLDRVSFFNGCHSTFPSQIEKESITLIVYNLGYLPGGNKELTTTSSTTLQSLQAALPLIVPGGAISITCYPGHPAGKVEETEILSFTNSLSPLEWSCCYHRWINRNQAPSLILIQRGGREGA